MIIILLLYYFTFHYVARALGLGQPLTAVGAGTSDEFVGPEPRP